MFGSRNLKLSELNKFFECPLCHGYLIDAVKIDDCLHTFCKTCLVDKLLERRACPICNTPVHNAKPWMNMRLDIPLQNIIYKLIPGLYEISGNEYQPASKEETGELDIKYLRRDTDELFCFVLFPNVNFDTEACPEIKENNLEFWLNSFFPPKYLQASSMLPIYVIIKYLRIKLSLPETCKVELMFGTSENISLPENLTLADVAQIYCWKAALPLKLVFKVNGKFRYTTDSKNAVSRFIHEDAYKENFMTTKNKKRLRLEESSDEFADEDIEQEEEEKEDGKTRAKMKIIKRDNSNEAFLKKSTHSVTFKENDVVKNEKRSARQSSESAEEDSADKEDKVSLSSENQVQVKMNENLSVETSGESGKEEKALDNGVTENTDGNTETKTHSVSDTLTPAAGNSAVEKCNSQTEQIKHESKSCSNTLENINENNFIPIPCNNFVNYNNYSLNQFLNTPNIFFDFPSSNQYYCNAPPPSRYIVRIGGEDTSETGGTFAPPIFIPSCATGNVAAVKNEKLDIKAESNVYDGATVKRKSKGRPPGQKRSPTFFERRPFVKIAKAPENISMKQQVLPDNRLSISRGFTSPILFKRRFPSIRPKPTQTSQPVSLKKRSSLLTEIVRLSDQCLLWEFYEKKINIIVNNAVEAANEPEGGEANNDSTNLTNQCNKLTELNETNDSSQFISNSGSSPKIFESI